MLFIRDVRKTIHDSDYREIISKGSSFLIIRIFGLFAGYVYTYLITKYYGAETFGLLSLCFSLFYFFGIIGRLGIDTNIVKFYAIDKNTQDIGLFYKVLLISFFISSFIAVVLYVFRDFFIYSVFNKPKLDPYIFWISLSIPFWSLALICGGLLRALKQNSWFAFFDNPGRFLFNVLFFLCLIVFIDSPLISAISHFGGIVILALVSFVVVFQYLKKITLTSNHSSWLFLKESFPMMMSSAIFILMGWLDTFILGIFDTSINIGIYNVALKISTLTGFSLMATNSILAPKISKLFNSEQNEDVNRMIGFTTAINFYFTLAVVSFIIFFHNELLSLFGNDFLKGKTILMILCFGQVINSLAGSVGVILQMSGKQIVFQNILFVALIMNLTLNLMLIPAYGGIGAAIATVVSMSFWNIAGILYIKVNLNIVSYYRFTKK